MRHAYNKRMTEKQLTNRLGALALAASDAQLKGATRLTGFSASSCALIVSLGLYPGGTVSEASTLLDLSHSATVRLTEKLAAQGFLTRRPGADKREVALALTAKGERMRKTILAAREEALSTILDGLTKQERKTLLPLLDKLLASLTVDAVSAGRMCRLCDDGMCGHDACPVHRTYEELEAAGAPH